MKHKTNTHNGNEIIKEDGRFVCYIIPINELRDSDILLRLALSQRSKFAWEPKVGEGDGARR